MHFQFSYHFIYIRKKSEYVRELLVIFIPNDLNLSEVAFQLLQQMQEKSFCINFR